MPRLKKAVYNLRGGKGRGWSNVERTQTSYVLFQDTNRIGRHSLRSEALNTQSSRFSDHKLRYATVNFVSGGELEPARSMEPEEALANMSLEEESQFAPQLETIELPLGPTQLQETTSNSPDRSATRSQEDTALPYVIDTHGSGPILTSLPSPNFRSVSPMLSDSSDEVIVFTGRDRLGKSCDNLSPISREFARPGDTRIRIVADNSYADKTSSVVTTETSQDYSFPVQQNHTPEAGFLPITKQDAKLQHSQYPQPIRHKTLGATYGSSYNSLQGRSCLRRSAKVATEQAQINDYIANMVGQDLAPEISFIQRDLGEAETDNWREIKPSRGCKKNNPISHLGHSEVHDLDDLSATGGVRGSFWTIHSKRQNRSGLQYLVSWGNHNTDETRWVPMSSLTDSTSVKLIEEFETEERLATSHFNGDRDNSDSSSDGGSSNGGVDEGIVGNDDVLQQKDDRMVVKKIARPTARQGELSFGSVKVMLKDDSSDIDNDKNGEDEDGDEGENEGEDVAVQDPPRRDPRPREGHGAKRSGCKFQNATALAAAYDDSNVIDFDQPSLETRKDGRKGEPAFDISDSELNMFMEVARSKNRSKKKKRKEERESLRSQGLLGNNGNKQDLRAKYKEGMSIHAFKSELEKFLMSDNTNLALPPMRRADRKFIHEFAHALNLESKSVGRGNKRFPILYRTSRTSSYSESTFTAVGARLTRRHLPPSTRGKNSKNPAATAKQRSPAASYRDGDIVGGSAPELGAENKGRAILEKMGWSTGTALGAVNNKGILLPVPHIVKTTKAGLG